MKDLKPGMELQGTVRNVIDFGAFVDIGVHQDGLVHLSQICDKYIKHPSEVLKSRRCGYCKSIIGGFGEKTYFPYHERLTVFIAACKQRKKSV